MSDEGTIKVKCVACGGTGVGSVQVQTGSPSATMRICQACGGAKFVEVKPGDWRWRFGFSENVPPVLVVTHGGAVSLGEPLKEAEVASLADHLPGAPALADPARGWHLVSCFLLVASELSKVRRDLAETKAKVEKLEKQVVEARIDAAEVRVAMRKRFGDGAVEDHA